MCTGFSEYRLAIVVRINRNICATLVLSQGAGQQACVRTAPLILNIATCLACSRMHSLVLGRTVGEGEQFLPESISLRYGLAAHEPQQERVLFDLGQAGGHCHSHGLDS